MHPGSAFSARDRTPELGYLEAGGAAYPRMMQAPAEPELTSEQGLALARGVAQFNRGLYFEGHHTLETVWSGLRGPSRDFFQGLIQVSVGFHHLDSGNRVGARKTFTRALGRFEAYPDRYCGFDLAAERVRLQALLAELTDERAAAPGPGLPPVWRFDDSPAAYVKTSRPARGGAVRAPST
jgi:predicted metal-dependent hydrolase